MSKKGGDVGMIDKRYHYGGFQVDCDCCGEHLAVEANDGYCTVKEAIETARMYGWSIGKLNLCPACRKDKKGQKETQK